MVYLGSHCKTMVGCHEQMVIEWWFETMHAPFVSKWWFETIPVHHFYSALCLCVIHYTSGLLPNYIIIIIFMYPLNFCLVALRSLGYDNIPPACCRVNQPTSLASCIVALQQKASLPAPKTEMEWLDAPRVRIDVRRSFVLADTFREMRKPRFTYNKLLEVQGW